jgi:ABC-type amino acid transport substrate-binding protein
MTLRRWPTLARALTFTLALASLAAAPRGAAAEPGGDLDAVRQRGVLRHLGVPYANFVTGSGDGFDVELMKAFAAKLGVRYEFVATDWPTAFPDLTGRKVTAKIPLDQAEPAPVRGDVLANGVTFLPWRTGAAAFSRPYFPTQVWVMARAESPVQPIAPTGNLQKDVAAVKLLLARRSVLSVPSTCLDSNLYQLDATGAKVTSMKLALNEVASVLLKGESDLSLLDVADAMIALEKWPGKLKVIGPISDRQDMGVVFRKESPQLRAAFDAFLVGVRQDGTYDRLVTKYFPEAPAYFPDAFGRGGAGGP